MYRTIGIDGEYFIQNKHGVKLQDPVFNNVTSAKNYADKLNQAEKWSVNYIMKKNGAILGKEIVQASGPCKAIARAKEIFIDNWPGTRNEAEEITKTALSYKAVKI